MHDPTTGVYISRRKILFTYLVTYLIIITVLFFVIGSFSYSNIIRIEQEKAKMAMEQAVTKAVDIMDTNLRDVLNLQSSFYVNPDVSRLRKMKADFKPKEYMRFLDMSNKLSMYTSTSQFLDQVTLFFHYNQLFIASNMLDSRPEVFYELNFSNKDITYTQWRNEQMQYKSRVFYVTEDSMDGCVNLYYRLPILDANRGVTVITKIKVEELIESLTLNDAYKDSVFILTDTEGNVLYSNQESTSELMQFAVSAPQNSNVTLGDTSYEYYSEKLTLLDWTISYFVSADDIYADSKKTQLSLLGLYSMVLITSLSLAVVFSKKISDPIASLLRLVDGWGKQSSFADHTMKKNHESFVAKNLYYVLNKVSDMSSDYMQLTSKVKEYKESSQGLLYNRLLKGEVISTEEIKMIEEDAILNFRYYTVAAARIISYDSNSIDVAMFVASEAFSNMRNNGIYFCKTAFDRFTIIICSNKHPDQNEITHIIKSLMKKVFLNSLISIRWGIGDTVTNLDQVFVSYRNAEYTLYNMDVLGSEAIAWYDSQDKQNNRLIYSFEDAQRFHALISNGDYENAIQAIKELMDRNKDVLQASKGQRTRFVSMLSETTLLLVSKLSNVDNQLEREIERVLRQMKRADNTDTILECISAAVEKLCYSVNSRNSNNHQRLIDKITTFIDNNYNDPNLSLTSIAQSMQLTDNYISSFFKQNKGINIQNYIEQKRMIKAVELLKGTTLPTVDIVEQIGYNNPNTFYKAFKRYYNMTPRECRESMI